MTNPTIERTTRLLQYHAAIEQAEKEGVVKEVLRELCLNDLFFLGVIMLESEFANNDWVFERCSEFENARDGFLDLWPREHFKSTIITLWAAVQEILRNPEITIGIFSFNRPIAKAFLRAIKVQFEDNIRLKDVFDDILFQNPAKESGKWSEDDGIIVKRNGRPKESTVEAWGLVDGQPTSKHFGLLIYDDVVTRDSVTSPEMIAKVTQALEISFNLGKTIAEETVSDDDGPDEEARRWFAGTRYHFADTYATLIQRGSVTLRKYAATVDGKLDGKPVLWSRKTLLKKIKDMGPYVSSCQLFNEPIMEGEQTFREEWLEYWTVRSQSWRMMNIYILMDPANSKKKKSDYTVISVIGLGADRNYYLIDMVRDKLSLAERYRALVDLHKIYHPLKVGYETYGMQADIDYVKEKQDQEQYRFVITPLGGTMGKNDRIKRLQPFFEDHRFYIPEVIMKKDYQGMQQDLIKAFKEEEFFQFPYMTHDDMLDCMSRICEEDMFACFPAVGAMAREDMIDGNENEEYDYDTYAYIGRGDN